MKKLMVVATVAMVAIGAQAASVYWGSYTSGGDKTFVVDKTGNQMSSTDYGSLGVSLILVSLSGTDLTAYQAGTYSAKYNESLVLSTGTISTKDNKAAQKGSFYTQYSFEYSDTTANPIKNNDVLGVLITDGKTMQNISYYNTDAKVVDTFTVSGLTDNLYDGTFYFATEGNFTANVPEPTSAMLLMLGLCGLALKRKNA